MKLPPLKKFVGEGERVWSLLTPTLRKLYHAHLEKNKYEKSVDGWKKFLTDYWNKCKKNPAQFGYDVETIMPVLKEGYKRSLESDKNHEKAMKQVELEDEKDIHGRIR